MTGYPGDHGIGVAQGHHAGAKDIPVAVHQPFDVAVKKALALQAFIQKVGKFLVPGAGAGAVNFQIGHILDAGFLEALADHGFLTDQDWGAITRASETECGAGHTLLLGLCKHHPAWIFLQLDKHLRQRPHRWVQPRA